MIFRLLEKYEKKKFGKSFLYKLPGPNRSSLELPSQPANHHQRCFDNPRVGGLDGDQRKKPVMKQKSNRSVGYQGNNQSAFTA
jgi:hypothetical protein